MLNHRLIIFNHHHHHHHIHGLPQLEYVEKQIVLEGTERQARQKLQEVRKQVPEMMIHDDSDDDDQDGDDDDSDDDDDIDVDIHDESDDND